MLRYLNCVERGTFPKVVARAEKAKSVTIAEIGPDAAHEGGIPAGRELWCGEIDELHPRRPRQAGKRLLEVHLGSEACPHGRAVADDGGHPDAGGGEGQPGQPHDLAGLGDQLQLLARVAVVLQRSRAR